MKWPWKRASAAQGDRIYSARRARSRRAITHTGFRPTARELAERRLPRTRIGRDATVFFRLHADNDIGDVARAPDILFNRRRGQFASTICVLHFIFFFFSDASRESPTFDIAYLGISFTLEISRQYVSGNYFSSPLRDLHSMFNIYTRINMNTAEVREGVIILENKSF